MTAYQFFRRLKRFSGFARLGCLVLLVLSVLSSLLFLGTDVPVEIGTKWVFILLVILSVIWGFAWFMDKLLEPIRLRD